MCATRPFREGDVVLEVHGPLLNLSQIRDFTHCMEIADGVFLGPSGGVDDFVNHSCDPNCKVEIEGGTSLLRALRDIAPGEEITYDYSTLMLRDPTEFACHCGSPDCRGVVRAFHSLPRDIREDHVRRGMVPAFVLQAG